MSAGSASPLEERLRWAVAAVNDPSGLCAADLEPIFDASEWREWSPEQELEFLRDGRHAASRPFTIDKVTLTDASEATAVLIGADGKRWSVTCWIEEAEPHRITGARTIPAPPEGTTIRLAEPEDGPALGELERHAPLRLGREPLTLMTFDHGDDYFAPGRLMADVTTYVAEVGGEVAGVYCGAVQTVCLDGIPKRLFLEHHVRINPATARGGVFWALCNFGRDAYARSTDSIAFYVSVDNHPVRKFVEGVPPWSVRPLRALIPCGDAGAEQRRGTPATESDASAIADILNACHGGSGLYVPYDESSLGTRFGRDPEQYGWNDVRLLGSAAVGVGRRLLTVTKECGGDVRTTRRALVLDHGFAEGAESDYRELLSEWRTIAASWGATHLAVFTSERSATFDVVTALAEEIEEFDFWAFDLPEPRALQERGFYVDPIYF